jgi:hypothetical protein
MPHLALTWYASYKNLPADKAEHPLKMGLMVRRHEALQKQARVPLDLYLILDSSVSMDTASKEGVTRLQRVTQAASAMVGKLAPGDGVALMCFGEQAHLVQPLRRLDSSGPAALANEVQKILTFAHPRAGTNLPAALDLLRRQLDANRPSGRFTKVLLLSDGENNRGDMNQAEADARGVSDLGGSIDAFGFGDDDEKTLGPLLRIAAAGGGQALPVPEGGNFLQRQLERLFASAQDVVVTQVQLTVRFADRVYPTDAFCHSPQRLYLDKVTLDEARSGYRVTLSHLERNPGKHYMYVFSAKVGPFAASGDKPVPIAEAHLRCDLPSAGLFGQEAHWDLTLPVTPADQAAVKDYDMLEVWQQVELTRLAFDYEKLKRAKGDAFQDDPALVRSCEEIIKRAEKWSDLEMQQRFQKELALVHQGKRDPAAFNDLLRVSTQTARIPTSMIRNLDERMFLI